MTHPPVVGGHTVYSIGNNNALYAAALSSGATITSVPLGASVHRFASPSISGNHIYIGTNSGVVAISIS